MSHPFAAYWNYKGKGSRLTLKHSIKIDQFFRNIHRNIQYNLVYDENDCQFMNKTTKHFLLLPVVATINKWATVLSTIELSSFIKQNNASLYSHI